MNAIQYGFHRLYLRYSSDEEYQIEAIARIVGREKDALDKLAVELALAESSIHLANIPAEPSARAPKTTKKRPSHGRAQKSSQAKYDKEGMIAAVQSGEVTADRVIENIKKRGALKEKRKSSGAKPRKKKARVEHFQMYESDEDDEEEEEKKAGDDRHQREKKTAKTSIMSKSTQKLYNRRRIDSDSDENKEINEAASSSSSLTSSSSSLVLKIRVPK